MKKLILFFFLNAILCLHQYAQIPTLAWARTEGSTSVDDALSVIADINGNVYSCGYFQGTVDFDPGPGVVSLTSNGARDMYIQKFDINGSLVWVKKIGGNLDDYANSITVDGSGNSFITGYFQNTVDFDPNAGVDSKSSFGVYDIFILKLDPSGNLSWVKQIGGNSFDVGNVITLDNSGNIYTTGYFSNMADFDPGPGTTTMFSNGGTGDVFIMKMDPSGNLTWVKTLSGGLLEEGKAIDVDNSGNVYVCGSFQTTVDFNPDPMITNNIMPTNWDGFVLKLNNMGVFGWAKKLGGPSADHCSSLTVSPSGDVYTTGDFLGTVDFNPDPMVTNSITASGSYNTYVQKMNTAGMFQWVQNIGSNGTTFSYSIALDQTEHVYTTGYFTNTVDFDPSGGTFSLTASGGTDDIFIHKMDKDGNFNWALNIGTTQYDGGQSIYVDALNNIYTCGHFQSNVDFDPGAGTDMHASNGGAYDIFILKLAQLVPLGVELIDVNGDCNGQMIELNWSTSSEINNDYFAIEKSKDLINWTEINRVPGSGTTNTFNSYVLTDHEWEGHIYYRLKQVDFDGGIRIYDPITITCQSENKVNIYPNPTPGEIHIEPGSYTNEITIEILSMDGKVVKNEKFVNNEPIQLNMIEPSGIYFIKIYAGDKVNTFKLVKE